MTVPYARKVFERISELHRKNAKPERELEEAKYELLLAEAKMKAAQTLIKAYNQARQDLAAGLPSFNFESGFPVVDLKAPISGVITHINAIVGEYAEPDQPIFSIRDPSTVYVEARVPETDLAKIGASHAAVYETPDSPDRYVPMLGEGGGRLVYLGQEVDKETRTVPLVYEAPNPEGRLPVGMALDIYVEGARAEDALVVPESALVEEAGRSNVFVMLAGETFERREIQIGIRDAGFVQVLAGLEEGERVVTLGAYAVRLASVGNSVPTHGHAH